MDDENIEETEQWKKRINYWQKVLIEHNDKFELTAIEPKLNKINETAPLIWESIYADPMYANRTKLTSNQDNPLSLIAGLIRLGYQPPTELLLVFLEKYNEYLDSKGSLTLEEVFHGASLKGVGNYAARYHRSLKTSDREIAMYLGKLHGFSQSEIAAEYTKDKPGLDDDTFLRSTRKRNKPKNKTDK